MNCQESRKKIPDLLNNGLTDAEASRLREHMFSCPSCREEFQELNETWTRLGILKEEHPGPELRRNFYRRLESYQKKLAARERTGWRQKLTRFLPNWQFSAPLPGFTAAVLVVGLGFAAGFFIGHAGKNGTKSLTALNREVDSLKQQVSLSLLNQSSASARLQGLSMTSKLQDPDPALIKTLLAVMDNDPSVNVRLSAIDALYLFADREDVRSAMAASLARQTSPLVQIALIDLMVSLREKRAVTALKKLLDDDQVIPEVRQRAQSGINQVL
ncbi:MAG: HEAT repeat domain-containing protein [Candidatus Aminicenantes bacterium]|nr:HEAT repeat domain-containing protein [Candidatus Aminicenantes bacterium]